MSPASSKPPSHNVPHPSQPWGTWEWACQVRRKMEEPSNEVTIHLCVGLLAGPPPSSKSASSLPAHYTMVSATVRSNHFTANFPNLKVLQKFPAQWISGLWIIWPQTYPFAFFHDDSHFCPCLSHFPNSFRLFLCLCSVFVIFLHSESSVNFIFKLLPEAVSKDRSEWDGRGGHFSCVPPEPTLWSQPSVLRAVSFHPAHFSIHVTGWQPICSAFIYATSQDPLLTVTFQNSHIEQLLLSVFMLGSHPQKRVCLHLKSHVGDCCQFNMFSMETQSSLFSPVGNHIPFYTSKLCQGYPSLFFYCCTE